MDLPLQQLISKTISSPRAHFIPIGGGSINETFRIETPNSKFFCKINLAGKFPGMFQKEMNGLLFLKKTNAIKVPEIIWCGEFHNKQVLILEWIEQGLRTDSFWKKFGEGLARLHQTWSDGGRPTRFGFHEDNYMGALPQLNTPAEEWAEFFITRRLQPQLKISVIKGLMPQKEVEQFNHLFQKLDTIFSMEEACPVHGDLWSGNYLCDQYSEPVLIDPAVYFGRRSIDLGMTRLFGGFDKEFYAAYHFHSPLLKHIDEEMDVSNLYPLLIHLNLFGSGYLSSIRSILRQYA